jgi:hypothetical protein
MDPDSRTLDNNAIYRFQVRLSLGAVAPVAPAQGMGELAAGLRRAGDVLSRRAEAVAAEFGRLGECGWRPLGTAPSGREVLAPHGFAGPDGVTLPEAVGVVRDATPAEVASELAGAGDEVRAELLETLSVRVEGLDIPVRVGPDAAELRLSPREYLDTFSIRG